MFFNLFFFFSFIDIFVLIQIKQIKKKSEREEILILIKEVHYNNCPI